MSTVNNSHVLPATMAGKLHRIRRRQMILSSVRAIALGASALIVAMLVAMTVDWWFPLFDPGVRMALTVGALAIAMAALLVVGIPSMMEAWRWIQAATGADRKVPQLQERWTTVALMAQANQQPTTPAARAMLEQVTREAAAMERLVQPSHVAPPAALRPAAIGLVSCSVVLAGFLALDWPRTSVLWQRFWSPRTAITATQVRSVTGDQVVPRGESLDLVTRLSGLPTDTAVLELDAGAEAVAELDLRPHQDRADIFLYRLRVDDSFRYRVRAGDDRTPWHTVTAVDYPALDEVQLTISPPEYTAQPPYQKTRIPSRVKVIQGSRLVLRMKPVAPLERLDLSLTFKPASPDAEPLRRRLTLKSDGNGWYRFEMQLLDDLTFSPTLLDAYGFANENKPVCRIQVVTDQAPVARILGPKDEMVVAPDNAIDVQFEAHDDHGIASAELVVYDESSPKNGEPPKILAVQPIPLDLAQLQRHVTGSTRLDLDTLGLQEGAQISYAIRVTDNREVTVDPDALAAQMTEERPNPADDAPTAERPSPEMPADLRESESQPLGEPREDTPAAAETLLADAGPDDQQPDRTSPNAAPTENLPAVPMAETQEDAPGVPQSGAPETDPQDHELDVNLADKDQQPPSAVAERAERESPAASPPGRPVAMQPQQSEQGQQAETNRQKLKIARTLTAVATASQRTAETQAIRERVVRIDELLAVAEVGLKMLVAREVADAERSDQFRRMDIQLGDVEAEIADLRRETKEHQHAFVGLQMVDIGRHHVTPARDRAFVGIREPLGSDHDSAALQQVVRARELLAALLQRYDRVTRDQKLAQALDETVTMYEVYIEKWRELIRAARQTQNPLQRKMAVIEVDQEYLDRYAEVLTLRRDMMAELARLLGDDPRLLARFLDLSNRRRASLRDQLSELASRQDETATEVLGWLQIGDAQRDVLWKVVAELRLPAATSLARDAAELAENVERQMPLVLESDGGTPAVVIERAQQIARLARQSAFAAEKFFQPDAQPDQPAVELNSTAGQLVHLCGELEAALDRLGFEQEDEEEVTQYVASRVLEVRTVADQADAWSQVTGHLQSKHYAGLAEIDQSKLALATELLRVEMLGIEDDLQNEFQQQEESSVPAEILDLVRQLHFVMESITFNQAAATFALTQNRLEDAARQQDRALQGFEQAEKLFDQVRRAVVTALDEYDPPDPTIAELIDPTLDEFLARLEREPNIEAQLGIPNRPRNLRVIAEVEWWQENGGDLLSQSSEAAAARARAMQQKDAPTEPPKMAERELTDEQREQRTKAREAQEELEKALASIQEKADDPQTSPQQRTQLEEIAENMQRMLDQIGRRSTDASEWERIAESDKAKSILNALARGEKLPDDQWNKLLSTLDDGLWQVRGRKPPEDYRKAIEQYQEFLRQSESGDGAR